MREEREELKRKLLSKKEAELEDLENSHPVHVKRSEKACSEENTKGVAALSLNR